MLRDLYVAEVFLSLDAAQDGEAFFRNALRQADTDEARLSREIVLGQILLLQGKHQEYAKLATEAIAPLLTKVLKPTPVSGLQALLATNALTQFVGGLAVLPFGAPGSFPDCPKDGSGKCTLAGRRSGPEPTT